MKSALIVLLLATLAVAEPIPFEWIHDNTALVDFYSLWRAHPDSLGAFTRVDTSHTRTIRVDIPRASVVYVTAIDTMGRESGPSPTLDLTKVPPPPKGLRARIQLEIVVEGDN